MIKSLTEAEIAELPRLPDKWKWARLGELVNDIVVGYVGPITQFLTDDLNNGVRFLSTTHIGDNQFLNHKESRYVTNEFSMNNKKSEVLAGDIIVARHGDSGKCCIIPPYIKKAQVSNAVIIRPNNELFVNLYIIYSFGYLKQSLQKKKVGGVQQVVNTKTMEMFPFPLPPLPEQHRIISAIEALFARLDATNEKLDSVLGILKKFRESVLAAACEGRLTEEWREKNPNIEDSHILMRELQKSQTVSKKKRAGRLWGSGIVPTLSDNEIKKTPDTWVWTKVKNLNSDMEITVQIGPMSMKSKEFSDKGVPVLNVGCIQWGKFDESKLNYLPNEIADQFDRYSVKKNDILFTRSGTVGRCAIATEKQDGYLMTFHLLRVRLSETICSPKYLYYVFQGAPHIREQMDVASIGSTRAGFNTKLLADLDVSLPPLLEQQEIIRRVDALFAFSDSIEAKVAAAREKTEKLRQSILAKAFNGELVPTEAELARREGRD